MATFFRKYLWLFKFIAVGLVLSLIILIMFNNDIVPTVIGCVFFVLGLFRIYPLIKYEEKNYIKTLFLIEVLVMVIVGVIFIFSVFTQYEEVSLWIEYKLFAYLFGGIFVLRGIIFFLTLNCSKESSKLMNLFTHIILLLIGGGIISIDIYIKIMTTALGFGIDNIQFLVLFIISLTCIIMLFDAVDTYRLFLVNKKGYTENDQIINENNIV